MLEQKVVRVPLSLARSEDPENRELGPILTIGYVEQAKKVIENARKYTITTSLDDTHITVQFRQETDLAYFCAHLETHDIPYETKEKLDSLQN